jgi:23S rRNA (cytidine1920-2'-O)/16S rRNA (cytidine1409-2'-O)-methyltransferase
MTAEAAETEDSAVAAQTAAHDPAEPAKAAGEAAGDARVRLDRLMVERGLAATRSAAQEAIRRGAVSVGGRAVAKTGLAVPRSAEIAIDGPSGYVGRGALKLIAALDHFGLDPAGRHALDLGTSTGGFVEVLLERGAAHVVAVDVGRGQLAPSLAADPRVTALEGHNARSLTAADLPYAPDFVTADLSFISL